MATARVRRARAPTLGYDLRSVTTTERLKIPSRYENLIMQTSDALLPRFIREVRPTLRAIDDIHLGGAPGGGAQGARLP